MKRVFRVLFLGVALFVMSGVAQAQVKIACLDSSEIMEDMPESATAQKALEKYAGEIQAQIQNMVKEYQTKMQDYEANQATMSNLVKQSKEKEIIDLQTRIQQFQANAEDEYAKKQLELVEPIVKKVQNAVDAIGKEKGYTMIIDKASAGGVVVYFGADVVDITKDVRTKLGLPNKAASK